MSDKLARRYWRTNLKIVLSLLSVWFLVSFGGGILLTDVLDTIRFGGFKLGFWIAQQGAICIFVLLIFVYIRLMDKLDDQYQRHRDSATHQQSSSREEAPP